MRVDQKPQDDQGQGVKKSVIPQPSISPRTHAGTEMQKTSGKEPVTQNDADDAGSPTSTVAQRKNKCSPQQQEVKKVNISLGGIKFPKFEKPAPAPPMTAPGPSDHPKQSQGDAISGSNDTETAKNGVHSHSNAKDAAEKLPPEPTPKRDRRSERSTGGSKELMGLIDEKFYCRVCGRDFYHSYAKNKHEQNCKYVPPPLTPLQPVAVAPHAKLPTAKKPLAKPKMANVTTSNNADKKYPRECPKCSTILRNSKTYRRHVQGCRRIQPGVVHKCDQCDKQLGDKGALTNHKRKFHPIPILTEQQPETSSEDTSKVGLADQAPSSANGTQPPQPSPTSRRTKFATPKVEGDGGLGADQGNHELECEVCHRVFNTVYSRQRHEGAVHAILTPRGGSEEATSATPGDTAASKKLKPKNPGVEVNTREPAGDYINLPVSDWRSEEKCPLCNKTFSSVSNTKRHLETVHKKKVKIIKLTGGGNASQNKSYKIYKITANKLKQKLASKGTTALSGTKKMISPKKGKLALPGKSSSQKKASVADACASGLKVSEESKPPVLERQARTAIVKSVKKEERTNQYKSVVLTTSDVICACCDKVFTAKCDFNQHQERKRLRVYVTSCTLCNHHFSHETDYMLHMQFRHRDLLAGMEERITSHPDAEKTVVPKTYRNQQTSCKGPVARDNSPPADELGCSSNVIIERDESAGIEDLAITANLSQPLKDNKSCPVCGIYSPKLGAHLLTHLNKTIPCSCTPCGILFPDITKLLKHNLEVHQGPRNKPVAVHVPPRLAKRISFARQEEELEPPPPVLEKCVKSPPQIPQKMLAPTKVASVTPALLSLLSKRQQPPSKIDGKSHSAQHPPSSGVKRKIDLVQATAKVPTPYKKPSLSNPGNKKIPARVQPPASQVLRVTGEKQVERYHCQYCSSSFSRNSELIAHVAHEHADGDEAEMTLEEMGIVGGISVTPSTKVEIDKHFAVLLNKKYSIDSSKNQVDPLEQNVSKKRKESLVVREVEEEDDEYEVDLDYLD